MILTNNVLHVVFNLPADRANDIVERNIHKKSMRTNSAICFRDFGPALYST